jgi:hypothetical protein
MMSESMDQLARTVAARSTRRSAVTSMGALALGALGIFGLGQGTDAKNSDNECQKCKKQCKKSNKKPGKKNPTNCSKKCNNKCKNN